MGTRTSVAVGVVALLVGLLWVGQGLGFIPGSFMTGARLWFWVGLALALVGAALLVRGLGRR